MLLLLWGLALGGATYVPGANQLKVWKDPPNWLIYASILVLSGQASLPLIRTALRRAKGEVTAKFARNTNTTLGQVFLDFSQFGLQLDEIGVKPVRRKRNE
jgi:hypothetical protein